MHSTGQYAGRYIGYSDEDSAHKQIRDTAPLDVVWIVDLAGVRTLVRE